MSFISYPEFKGQVVFVTGAASGIGAAQARAFLDQGANVFGFDCQREPLKALKKTFSNFAYVCGDVRSQANLQAAVASCLKTFERIDILLNTAGKLDGYQPLMKTDEALWDLIFDTNLKSMFYLTKQVLPIMIAQHAGIIINMASIAGFVAGGGGIAYTASKHAIIGFTKQLALDYSGAGIRVNALAPGAINTPMNAADFSGDQEMAKWVAHETPLKRWAQPEEVGQVTLFYASQQSSYVQGTVIPIDGGWLLK